MVDASVDVATLPYICAATTRHLSDAALLLLLSGACRLVVLCSAVGLLRAFAVFVLLPLAGHLHIQFRFRFRLGAIHGDERHSVGSHFCFRIRIFVRKPLRNAFVLLVSAELGPGAEKVVLSTSVPPSGGLAGLRCLSVRPCAWSLASTGSIYISTCTVLRPVAAFLGVVVSSLAVVWPAGANLVRVIVCTPTQIGKLHVFPHCFLLLGEEWLLATQRLADRLHEDGP